MTTVTKEFIRENSIPEPNSGCWLWTGFIDRQGYGRCGKSVVNGTTLYISHRAAFAAFKGDPTGKMVCHRCDTPSCVNPDHLFLGDAKTNNRDRALKKRSFKKKGFWPKIVLTPDAVKEIRSSKETITALSRRLGASRITVLRAKRFQTWKPK